MKKYCTKNKPCDKAVLDENNKLRCTSKMFCEFGKTKKEYDADVKYDEMLVSMYH